MVIRTMLRGALLLLLLGMAVPAAAETRYVSDVLVVNLRDAPASGAVSIAHLRTGDGFEVLETRDTYLRVRTPTGEEGWVPAQYTTPELPKARVIEGLRRELSRLKTQAAEANDGGARLEAQLQDVLTKSAAADKAAAEALAAARKEGKEAHRNYQRAKKKYDALLDKSQRVLEITAERDRLREENGSLLDQTVKLNDEVAALTRSTAVRWLLAGGGLLLVGWLIGSTSRKKKGRYSVG